MNPETEKLLRQLEQATSPALLDVNELDDETRALREGWLAFEQVMQGSHCDDVAPLQSVKPTRVPWQTSWTFAVSIILLAGAIGGSVSLSDLGMQAKQAQIAQGDSKATGSAASL